MRIDELFQPGKSLVSFEFFPPKNDEGVAHLLTAIDELRPLNPDFVSVTRTGAGIPGTLQLTSRIQNDLKIRAAAHLTCVGVTHQEMSAHLDQLWQDGVCNVLALRGDAPAGGRPDGQSFCYGSDLAAFIASRNNFCIGVAGYPECHPQALNATRDLEYLKLKVDNGASFVITQLFFDNETFYRWRDAARAMDIKVPIMAGIMPILGVAQIKRFVTMCGARIPHPLLVRLESLEPDPLAVHAAGVDYAIRQCEDLLAHGVDGLHFYTLNRSKATALIGQALRGAMSS